jgi:hypothetical protein
MTTTAARDQKRSSGPELPDWMRSPPTPEHPEHMDATEPPDDLRTVVEISGRLYDRITLYRWHDYTPPAVLDKAGAILATYLRREWSSYYGRGAGLDTDARPENRERRAELVTLATEAAAGRQSPALERLRAWRIIDWRIRMEAAAKLELAGWTDYAAAFRALPPITGPRALPRGAATLFRKAHRDTDKASTAALQGVRPYRRDLSKPAAERYANERTRRLDVGEHPAHALEQAAREALPVLTKIVKADEVPSSERTDLGRALLASAYARMCIEHDPRISDAEVARMLRTVAASGRELLRELITMGRG